jgi:hypothetical protein
MGALFMLEIEIDGHFHGTPRVPKPWVARIDGPDPKYGLAREFISPFNDWENARRAHSGNIYGRVANFPLRRGHIYEVSRLEGRPSKRHIIREFAWLGDDELEILDPEDVLDRVADTGTPGVSLETDDGGDPVGQVHGLGYPLPMPWIVRDNRRLFRLGEHQVYTHADRLLGVRDDEIVELDQEEAWSWLR